MRPVPSWQEKQNCAQNTTRFEFHLCCDPCSKAFVSFHQQGQCFRRKNIPAPHSCWLQLNWSWEWGWGYQTPGLWVRKWSETHQQLFILHFPRVEQRHWGVDRTLQLLSSPSSAGSRSLGDNPVWIPSFGAGQRTKPSQSLLTGREGRADFTGPKITFELPESYNSGQSLKSCPFSNVNNIKMLQ